MSRYVSWGIILDDIIYPDGQTAMGILGGGGLHAVCGMRLWHPDVTICSAVGKDFDAGSLAPLGLDGSGLVITELPTPRAWQVLEEDGRRTQIPRVSPEAWYSQLVQTPLTQPIPASQHAIHFLLRGHVPEENHIKALAQAEVIIGAEPIIPPDSTAEEIDNIRRCLPYFELFSPDESEATALVGKRPIKEQLRALAKLGPRVVALRRGKAGSLVYERENDQFWRVPAAKAHVIDVTGAGNAFCGGLLVGWVETADIRQAAAQATVSAAIAIEQTGPSPIDATVMAKAKARADEVIQLIHVQQE
jgi:sugar/nucleoside kinase (ribokinase family)